MFKCDFDPEYLCMLLPLFYQQMLYAWFEYRSLATKINPWEIRRKTIVFNKEILIGKQYAKGSYLRWFDSGIKQINDLYDKKGNLYPISYLQEKYSINIDTLAHNSLISAIPPSWKNAIKNVTINPEAIHFDELPHFHINGKPIPITLLNNKSIYWSLIKQKTKPPISKNIWSSLFNINESKWSFIFKIPYEVTYETQIQSFIYKIILRIFPCNWYVSKFDPNVDEICSFCSEATDDLCHYFYDCRLCVHFWNSVKDWLRHRFNIGNIDEYINKQSVILGLFSSVENVSAVNFILLYAKWFIYLKKNNNVYRIDIQEFLNLLRSKLEINIMVARHQNNNILISKMSPLISLLEQPT